jgi:sugar (pentulose or hexulose) kinase
VPIAVIDIGKTNAKALLFDRSGAVLAERSTPNVSLKNGPYLHADEAALWDFILDSLAALNRIAPVETISVTTHGAAGAVIDDHGLVLPIMDYEERAIDGIEADYAPFRPPFSESFSPPMTGGLNLGRQVFYQSRLHPAKFAKARHLLCYPQYWTWRLTGIAAGEATSLGCHTDLWSPAKSEASSMARHLGFDRLIPPIRKASEPLGSILPDLAKQTGLSRHASVLCGIHDSNASLALHLTGREPPFTVISTGTWIVLLSVGGDLARLDPAADMMANVDAAGRAVACAKFMGGREFAAIAEGAEAKADLAATDKVVSKGIFALPAFSDQGGPYAGRRGALIGELGNADERIALASLYCALVTDDQLTRLDAKGPLIVDGNFARNEVYLAALAAFRPDQPVEASMETAGTAKGAASLALWPEGVPAEATGRVPPKNAEAYAGYRERWRRMVAVH